MLLNWLLKLPVQPSSDAAILCQGILQTPSISFPALQTSPHFMSSGQVQENRDNR